MWALDFLQDFKVAQIVLPLRGGKTQPLECVARSSSPPFFETHFLPGQLQIGQLDSSGVCQLSFEHAGRIYGLKARIEKILDGEKLRLVALETVAQVQKREFFRIDVAIALRYQRLDSPEANLREVRAQVNLSGGGIRFPSRERFKVEEKIGLEIHLPETPEDRICCVGHVVRVFDENEGSKAVALQFVEIEAKDRDHLIAFCFSEQRKALRNKIKVLDLG